MRLRYDLLYCHIVHFVNKGESVFYVICIRLVKALERMLDIHKIVEFGNA